MEPDGPISQPESTAEANLPAAAEIELRPEVASDGEIAWEASEHVHYEKDTLWLVGVVVVALIFAVLSWLFFRSWTFAILIVVMAVAVIVMAYRPPRILRYKLDNSGIHVEEKHYRYSEFRAFGVQREGGIYSLLLLPVKRLMPAVSIYFPPDQGEQIVDVIGNRLPMEEIKTDIVDRVSQKLRF